MKIDLKAVVTGSQFGKCPYSFCVFGHNGTKFDAYITYYPLLM